MNWVEITRNKPEFIKARTISNERSVKVYMSNPEVFENIDKALYKTTIFNACIFIV